ncbi:MarR family transcriptional regulator [Natronomonas marina]|uniref:MarR family transcriptional regulator n=1 Tax=Natronomonas marina TaxID=2961939 RepID=UPI0020C9D8BD|nr:helix-turn-helix domain-containing protein [Natronomonas marina]
MAVENRQNGRSIPRSVRQKQILDVAAEHPDASLETIAMEVQSATVDLVERVLEEYGDPATGRSDQPDTDLADNSGDPPETNSTDTPTDRSDPPEAEPPAPEPDEDLPDHSSLTDEQWETLRAIYRNPEATQKEIGERLDVARATVSNRVNAIDGFDWDDRYAMASAVFDASAAGSRDVRNGTTADVRNSEPMVEQLSARIEALERQLEDSDAGSDAETPLDDPQLAHRVMHACLKSDAITEPEELRIVKALIE